jgi:hypothetical protein
VECWADNGTQQAAKQQDLAASRGKAKRTASAS